MEANFEALVLRARGLEWKVIRTPMIKGPSELLSRGTRARLVLIRNSLRAESLYYERATSLSSYLWGLPMEVLMC